MSGSNNNRSRVKYVTGMHIVKRQLKGGTTHYVYAWRGGPRIAIVVGNAPPVITNELLYRQQRAIQKHRQARRGAEPTLSDLINQYTSSETYKGLSDRTQAEYRRYIGIIDIQFGSTPLSFFERRMARGQIIRWKDTFAHHSRKADMLAMVFNILLGFGVEIGALTLNVAKNIKKLHKSDRSDLIWEPKHWEAFYAAGLPEHVVQAIEFASLTGLRLGDLITARWDQVGLSSLIIEKTQKRKTRAVVPITKELNLWFKKQDEPHQGTILKNSRGIPWSVSGLKGVWQKKRPEGFDRHLHDLRGTYATKLVQAGLTDQEVGYILGWGAKRISDIRVRYVNEERIVRGIAERLNV